MKRLVLFSFIFLILVMTPYASTAGPIHGPDDKHSTPSITVRKWISSDNWAKSKDNEILLGSSITVHVNITNLSKQFAKNMTVVEPTMNSENFDTKAQYTKYHYLELGYGGTIEYTYTVTPKVTGNFTLDATTVSYLDKNGTHYEARSGVIQFKVLQEPPKDNTPDIWKNLALISSIFVAIPLIVFIANFVLKRR